MSTLGVEMCVSIHQSSTLQIENHTRQAAPGPSGLLGRPAVPRTERRPSAGPRCVCLLVFAVSLLFAGCRGPRRAPGGPSASVSSCFCCFFTVGVVPRWRPGPWRALGAPGGPSGPLAGPRAPGGPRALLCCAFLCSALLCFALLCFALLCFALLCLSFNSFLVLEIPAR